LLTPAAKQKRDAIAPRRERRCERHVSDLMRVTGRVEIHARRQADLVGVDRD
jgi:hypothetical protein